eukprot:5883846-Pyramimonas_sp.AAC.1
MDLMSALERPRARGEPGAREDPAPIQSPASSPFRKPNLERVIPALEYRLSAHDSYHRAR